jgi:hypothetical protein
MGSVFSSVNVLYMVLLLTHGKSYKNVAVHSITSNRSIVGQIRSQTYLADHNDREHSQRRRVSLSSSLQLRLD